MNNVVSETPLKFSNLTLNNPRSVLATSDDTPIHLHCQVFASVSNDIKDDFQTKKNFYLLTPNDVDREKEKELHYSDDFVKKMYDAQTKRFNKQNGESFGSKTILFNVTHPKSSLNDITFNKNEDEDEDYDEDDDSLNQGSSRSKRDTHDFFSYEWMKNDKNILSFNYSMNGNQPKDSYTLFSNGTLKFLPSNSTIGVYRCKVKFTYLEQKIKKGNRNSNKDFEIGPILSQATIVESRGKF